MKKINCIDRALTLSHASQSSIFSFNSVVHSVLLFVPFVQAMLFLRHLIFPILFSNVPKNRAMRSSHTHTPMKKYFAQRSLKVPTIGPTVAVELKWSGRKCKWKKNDSMGRIWNVFVCWVTSSSRSPTADNEQYNCCCCWCYVCICERACDYGATDYCYYFM